MANRKVKRNTSKQIISYTLDPEGTDSYGTVKFAASKTVYGKDGFNKVLYRQPTELVNADPSLELRIINEEKLDLRNFTGFKDEFSARYELPPNDKKFYSYNQSFESATRPYGSTNLGFSKVVYGPPQTSAGRYTITKELIDSGNDLKLTYQIRSFDKREVSRPSALTDTQAANYLDRYSDLRAIYGIRVNGIYLEQTLAFAKYHWVTFGKTAGEQRVIFFPVGINTQFQRIRKSSTDTSTVIFGNSQTVSDNVGPYSLNNAAGRTVTLRPPKNNGFNHVQAITILNEEMVEFDEWQLAGSCGTSNNAEVGYLVDSSFWDIQLISN